MPLRGILLALAGILLLDVGFAHELTETTARVVLREGQVELTLGIDWERWEAQHRNPQAWLMGDIDELLSPEATAEEVKQKLLGTLQREMQLLLDQVPVQLQLRETIPNPHGHQVQLVLEGPASASPMKQVQLQLPVSLGPVHFQLLRPIYRYGKAGTRFTVPVP